MVSLHLHKHNGLQPRLTLLTRFGSNLRRRQPRLTRRCRRSHNQLPTQRLRLPRAKQHRRAHQRQLRSLRSSYRSQMGAGEHRRLWWKCVTSHNLRPVSWCGKHESTSRLTTSGWPVFGGYSHEQSVVDLVYTLFEHRSGDCHADKYHSQQDRLCKW